MEQLITIREAISGVKKGLREVNADSRTTNKFVYSVFSRHLKYVLSRDSDAFRLTRRNSLYQTLRCVKVIEAPAIDPCCGLRTRCTVYRTEDRLPDVLEDSTGPRIKLVAPIDSIGKTKGNGKTLKVINATDWLKKIDNPWNKWSVSGFVIYNDGYLYFPNERWKLVLVEAAFLLDVVSPCDEEEEECKRFMDKKIHAPERQVAEAIGKTIEEIGGVYKQVPPQLKIDKIPVT